MTYYEPEYTETFDQTTADSYYSAYETSDQTSWAAWNASVDAYVDGDQGLAYDLNQVSIDAAGVADQAWDNWNAEYQQPVDYGYDAAGSDTSSYDTSSYDSSWSASE